MKSVHGPSLSQWLKNWKLYNLLRLLSIEIFLLITLEPHICNCNGISLLVTKLEKKYVNVVDKIAMLWSKMAGYISRDISNKQFVCLSICLPTSYLLPACLRVRPSIRLPLSVFLSLVCPGCDKIYDQDLLERQRGQSLVYSERCVVISKEFSLLSYQTWPTHYF